MACEVLSVVTLRNCVISDLYGSDPAFGPATLALESLFRMRALEGQTLAEGTRSGFRSPARFHADRIVRSRRRVGGPT